MSATINNYGTTISCWQKEEIKDKSTDGSFFNLVAVVFVVAIYLPSEHSRGTKKDAQSTICRLFKRGKKADEASELVADNTTGTSSQLSCETEKINK